LQALVLHAFLVAARCDGSVGTVFSLSYRSGRQPKTYAKPDAAISFELLMMGGVLPETC
jgi:hypothetical protein